MPNAGVLSSVVLDDGVPIEDLGHPGPFAKPAIPGLTRLLPDDVPPVRKAASDALDRIR